MRSKTLDLFKALADQTRQEILHMLKEHEMNVTEICKAFERMTQPTISHHLHILRSCDLVDTRREGKLIYYFLREDVLKEGVREFFDFFEAKLE